MPNALNLSLETLEELSTESSSPTPESIDIYKEPKSKIYAIESFNKKNGLEQISAWLQKRGYQKLQESPQSNNPCCRFIAPNSTSGTAGVVFFWSEKYQKNLVYSHHGSHDLLAQIKNGKQHAIDSFEVFTILEHSGDKKAALIAARKQFQPEYAEVKTIIEEHGSEYSIDEKVRIISTLPCSQAIKNELLKLLSKKDDLDLAGLKYDFCKLSNKGQPEVAEEVISTIGKANLIYFNESFYQWNGQAGVWLRIHDETIKREIHTCMESLSPRYTANQVNGVLSLIKTQFHSTDQLFNTDKIAVNCKNGTLFNQGGELTLQPHCREDYFTTQIPVDFSSEAQAPKFEKFLDDIFLGDFDKEEKKTLILQFICYSTLNTSRYEKFLILIGNGANGKSVLLSIIEALVGATQVCGVQPKEFDNRFQLALMQHKLVNIVTELTVGKVLPDGAVKAIVSGELITVEQKYKEPFSMKPICTCWFATNHMPHVRDFSNALVRRAELIQFNNQFTGDKCDPHLKETLIAELPGIFQLAVKAFSKVLANNSFQTCPSSERLKKEWMLEANQAAMFVEEACKTGGDLRVEIKDLYSSYLQWCRESGIGQYLTKKTFGNRMDLLGFKDSKSGGVRYRVGISLLEPNIQFTPIPICETDL